MDPIDQDILWFNYANGTLLVSPDCAALRVSYNMLYPDTVTTPNAHVELRLPDYYGSVNGAPFVVAELKKPGEDSGLLLKDRRKLLCLMKLGSTSRWSKGSQSPLLWAYFPKVL